VDLHGDRAHAASLKPVRQALQITCEGPEAAHRLSIAIRRHRSHVHLGANVDRRRISMRRGDVPIWVRPLRFGHDPSSLHYGGAGLHKDINFLTGIAAKASPLSSAHRPMGHVF
jgi:hypothetical protein